MAAPVMSTGDALTDVERILRALPLGDSPERINANRDLSGWLGQPIQTLAILRNVLSDPGALLAVASRSYPHINLFDKIVLVGGDDPSDYRLTLHLWTPPYTDSERSQELIHAHRFNFWSTVLTGTLTSERFELAASGRPFHRYRYVPETARTVEFCDFYEFCGAVRLANNGPERQRTGTTYYLAAPTIHRIIVPRESMTCSMVLRGPRLQDHSDVYNTSYPSQSTRFANKMFSPGQLRVRLARLLGVLEAQWGTPSDETHDRGGSQRGREPRSRERRAATAGSARRGRRRPRGRDRGTDVASGRDGWRA